jgi:hypothetical protein
MTDRRIYCFDTSGLMDGRTRDYPPHIFPQLWKRIEDLIAEGRLIAPEEVWVEIDKNTDELRQWAKLQSGLFAQLDVQQIVEVQRIMKDFPRLVDTRKGRSRGDPFVIALAKVRNCTVVTGEAGGTREKPKIPSVCDYYDIECITFLKMLELEAWTF